MENSREFWDKRAKTFPRYDGRQGSYERHILALLKQEGIDFRGKKVLDIGAGTGMFTLHIAQEAAEVTALDISEEMLKILMDDASKLRLYNINTKQTDWMVFNPEKDYDIVFSSMCPALESEEARLKWLGLNAGRYVYIAYNGLHASNILEPLRRKYAFERKHINMTENMRHWLDSKGISYKEFSHEGEWTDVKTEEYFRDTIAIFAEERGITLKMTELRDYLQAFKTEGGYREITAYKVGVLLI